MDFILATNNMKKLAEMQRILSPLGINVVTAKMLGKQLEDVEEDGKTCVYRKTESGGMETVEVETGFTDMSHVEIKSGLSEDDTVYLKSMMTAGSEEFTGKEEAAGGMESMEDQNTGGKGGTGKE